MIGKFALGLLGNLLNSTLADAGEATTDRLDLAPSVRRAIDTTATQFPDLELKSLLKIWCSSDSFRQIVARAGSAAPTTDDELLDSFFRITRFESELELATQVLTFFFSRLEEELLQEPSNALEHDALEAMRHEQTQVAIADTQKVIQENSDDLRQEIRNLGRMMERLRDGSQRRSAEEPWDLLVDDARDKLQSGQVLQARTLLGSVRVQTQNREMSDEFSFRLATNLGACALELGDEEKIQEELEKALAFQPKSAQALSNGAVAAYLRGDDALAIERGEQALAQQPDDANALSIQIQAIARHAPQKLEDFVAQAWQRIKKAPVAQLGFAAVRAEQNRWQEARRLAYHATQGDPSLANAHQIYASCILVPLQRKNLSDPPVKSERLTTVSLCLAEKAQSQAVNLLRDRAPRTAYAHALAERAVIRLMRSDIEGCLEDCETILHGGEVEESVLETAQQQKGIALIRSDRYAEAVAVLQLLQSPTRRREVVSALAFALLRLNRFQEALKELQPHWQPRQGNREQLEFAEYLLEAYHALRSTDEAAQIVVQVEQTWGDDPDASLVLSRYFERSGDEARAKQLLEIARQSAPTDSRAWQRATRRLADFLFRRQAYDDAIDLYEAIVDFEAARDNSALANYIVALYYARQRPGALQKALELSHQMREREGVLETVSEVEACILSEVGRLEEARALFLDLARINPDHLSYRLRAIQFALMLENKEAARAEVVALDERTFWNDATALIQVAQMQTALDMPDALRLAYRARQLGFGDAEVHRAYIGLFLHVTRDYTGEASGPLDSPPKVVVDSGVRLQRENDQRAYVISSEGPYHEDRGELAPTHPIAKKLLGLRRGERVTLGIGPREARYEVAEVLHPYVLAFQDSISHFSEWFADNDKLTKLRVAEGDVSEMLGVLDERHRFVDSLLQLYRDWKVPISFFARHVGRSIFEVWSGLRVEAGAGIHSDRGHAGEEENADLLPGVKELVLDATALITLHELGLVEKVKARFPRLLVPISVAEEIRRATTEAENDQSSGTVGRNERGYFLYDYPSEQKEQWLGFVRGVRDLMETDIEVTTTDVMLQLSRERAQEMRESLGAGALEALLLSCDDSVIPIHSTMLWSDDAGLREIGQSWLHVRGVSSFRVLLELWRSKVLTRDEFQESWQRLIVLGYRFLPVTAEFLTWTLERENFRVTDEVRAVFASLEPPTVEEDAIQVAAETLKLVWQARPIHPREFDALDLCLSVLTKGEGRDSKRVLDAFEKALNDRQRFGLLPLENERIKRAIRAWARTSVQMVERRLVIPSGLSQPYAATNRSAGVSIDVASGSNPSLDFNGMYLQPSKGHSWANDAVSVAEGEHDSLIRATQAVEQSVVCLLSALQFHVLTTQNPFQVWLAVSRQVQPPVDFYPPIRVCLYPAETLVEGVEKYEIEECQVRITNPARTVIDCFRFRDEVGLEVALEALRDCLRQRKGTPAEFQRYARLWNIEAEIRPYLEALLG